ncbi:hypothetical protein D3C75_1041030 [compost metagenome]
MPRVGQASREVARFEISAQRLRDHDAADRDIPRVHPLGEGDEIRHNTIMLQGEPLARPTKTGHYFIQDEQYAEFICQFANTLHIGGGRH